MSRPEAVIYFGRQLDVASCTTAWLCRTRVSLKRTWRKSGSTFHVPFFLVFSFVFIRCFFFLSEEQRHRAARGAVQSQTRSHLREQRGRACAVSCFAFVLICLIDMFV